uniref:Uncharacterized protein n=1 Tax=Rhizophora mucronata TaxID=61149 RepID=A0A2P2PP72_RHIMU
MVLFTTSNPFSLSVLFVHLDAWLRFSALVVI